VSLGHHLKVQGEFVEYYAQFVIRQVPRLEAASSIVRVCQFDKLLTNSDSLNGIMIKKEFVLSLRFLPRIFYLSDKLVWEPKLPK